MKSYLKNIFIAIMGRNPFIEQLDELRDKYNKVCDKYEQLNELYMNAIERWCGEVNKDKADSAIIENLRERLADEKKEAKKIQERYDDLLNRLKFVVDAETSLCELLK